MLRAPRLVADENGRADGIATPPTAPRIAGWVALAFIPSIFRLGVTINLSTDRLPGPLIGAFPLGVYLLSLVLAFSRLPPLVHTIMTVSLPAVVLVQICLMLAGTSPGKVVLIGVNLMTLFVVAMVCHGKLANHRPDPKFLTGFYLSISLGGVLGGRPGGLG